MVITPNSMWNTAKKNTSKSNWCMPSMDKKGIIPCHCNSNIYVNLNKIYSKKSINFVNLKLCYLYNDYSWTITAIFIFLNLILLVFSALGITSHLKFNKHQKEKNGKHFLHTNFSSLSLGNLYRQMGWFINVCILAHYMVFHPYSPLYISILYISEILSISHCLTYLT